MSQTVSLLERKTSYQVIFSYSIQQCQAVVSIQDIKVSVNAVVFGYTSESGLYILLIKRIIDPYAGQWALPGRLVLHTESLETSFTSMKKTLPAKRRRHHL